MFWTIFICFHYSNIYSKLDPFDHLYCSIHLNYARSVCSVRFVTLDLLSYRPITIVPLNFWSWFFLVFFFDQYHFFLPIPVWHVLYLSPFIFITKIWIIVDLCVSFYVLPYTYVKNITKNKLVIVVLRKLNHLYQKFHSTFDHVSFLYFSLANTSLAWAVFLLLLTIFSRTSLEQRMKCLLGCYESFGKDILNTNDSSFLSISHIITNCGIEKNM